MSSIRRALVPLVLLALTIVASAGSAMQKSGGQPDQPAIVHGELLTVDPVAKTLTIRTSDKIEMQFQYTEQTEITGATEGTAGLATMRGAQVNVFFIKVGHANVATKIQVRSVLKLA